MVTLGMVMFGLAMAWVSTAGVDTPYATEIVPQMVLMGLGMGFISAPATESIMLVLPPSRAGIGSAVNDATRELGATLGVALVGSLFSSIYAARLAEGAYAALPDAQLAEAGESVAVAGICFAGALLAAVLLPGRDPSGRQRQRQPEERAEPQHA